MMTASVLDLVVVTLSIGLVVVVVALCVRYFLVPGETSESHIKRRILR